MFCRGDHWSSAVAHGATVKYAVIMNGRAMHAPTKHAVSKTVGAGIFSQVAAFSDDGVQRYSEDKKVVRCGKITSRTINYNLSLFTIPKRTLPCL